MIEQEKVLGPVSESTKIQGRKDLSVIIGPPMAGKTTYVQSLALERNVTHISVGKICRDEAKRDTEFGQILRESIKNNTFLDSSILLPLILDTRINDDEGEFIMDGYPKYRHETGPLLRYSQVNGIRLLRLYHMNVDLTELLKRLDSRYTCGTCYMPIQGECMCLCGGLPFRREEDTKQYFMSRYSRYLDHAGPILESLSAHFMEVRDVR